MVRGVIDTINNSYKKKNIKMNNADRLAVFIVDKVADAIKTQFGDKVSFTTLDTVRSVAAVAVKNAVPFPMRLALNAIPASEGNMRLV